MTPFADIFGIIRTAEFQQKYNLTSIYSVLCSPLQSHESHQIYKGLIDIAVRTIDVLTKEIYLNDKEIFDKTNAYVLFREEVEKIVTNQEELNRIYELIKTETGVDITKYVSATGEAIAPEPSEWINFIESDLYPEGVEKPELGSDPVKMFWDQWPSTLNKDRDKLLVCYHFGMYMARKVLGTPR